MAKRGPPAEAEAGTGPPPCANPDLLGHEEAQAALVTAWRAGRLPHAWLIHGPRGVGKATLAYRFARFLLAEDEAGHAPARRGPGLAVDPSSPVFCRIAAGGHTDLLTVAPGIDEKTGAPRRMITVDKARRVKRFLALTPGEGLWRVVVVDTADELNRDAANAILKPLEDPPRRVVFLLLSRSPARLLPTLRSRCRRLALAPLPDARVERFLRARLPELTGAQARALAGLARGSPGRALDLAAERGLELHGRLQALIEGLPELDRPAVHAFAERLARRDAERDFRTARWLLTSWLADHVKARARAGELEQWLSVWEKVSRLFDQAERYGLDRKQVVLNAFTALQGASRA